MTQSREDSIILWYVEDSFQLVNSLTSNRFFVHDVALWAAK